jgi:ferredoxin-NADP reductase
VITGPAPTSLVGPTAGTEIEGLCVCREVEQVTHDVKSFVLDPPRTGGLGFEPGQYLTVTVDVGGRRLSRCYSISSPSTRPDRLTITVKRVPGGPVSNWLHDHLVPGATLEVSGPLGSFTRTRHPSPRQLYLSAGSGITPLMSMARTIADRGEVADLVFVHHARSPADLIFRDELGAMAQSHPGIRVVLVCEEDAPEERWPGRRGRISRALLDAVAPDVAAREVFVCGPPPYREAARRLLHDAGADAAQVHEESYEIGASSPVPAPRDPVGTQQAHLVELRRTGSTFECGAGTTILDAATRAGVTLPSSCQEGVCGTCKTTMLSGTVDMHHAGGIRPREIERQQILLCCSTPTGPLVLDA